MLDKTDKTRKGQKNELKELAGKARKAGAIKIERPGGDLFLIALRHGGAAIPPPFGGNEKLLGPPLARAAYSDRMAWQMAVLSQIAYDPYETGDDEVTKLAAKLSHAGLVLVEIFENPNSGTQAFLARKPDNFNVLAFRGTEKNRKDIRTDLNARFYNTREGKAHMGFATAYESVRKDIEATLGDLRNNNRDEQLFITGHSLGGALATVAARELEDKFLVSACYTFGSPRVGNAEWSDAVKTPVYRVVNGADGVPLLPGSAATRWVLKSLRYVPFLSWGNWLVKKGYVGFQHAGDLRFLQGNAGDPKLKIGSAAFWARLRHVTYGGIVGAIKSLNPKALSALFSDHAIARYAEKLHKIAEIRN